ATANHYGLSINLLRCALRARFIKSGRNALRPYILVSIDIVLGFGISGEPLRSAAKPLELMALIRLLPDQRLSQATLTSSGGS
ncbi:MAG: hypothetical protein WCY84_06845, partial [Candidatus Cloacimonadaceae bacterium]